LFSPCCCLLFGNVTQEFINLSSTIGSGVSAEEMADVAAEFHHSVAKTASEFAYFGELKIY